VGRAHLRPEQDDFDTLKDEYKGSDVAFKVRKYFASDEKDDEGKERSGLYGSSGNKVSGSHLYGAKKIQQAKLGKIIYIPAVTS